MTKNEFVEVMAVASALDSRLVVTKETMAAWFAICGHVDAHTAIDRVRKHYGSSEFSLMPKHLVAGDATPSPTTLPLPPVDPDDVPRYRGWLAAYSRALSLGNDPDNAQCLADNEVGAVRTPQIRTRRPLALPALASPQEN